jgi:hypothetical protein
MVVNKGSKMEVSACLPCSKYGNISLRSPLLLVVVSE